MRPSGDHVDKLTAETVADARWFPLRYDAGQDEFCFAWVPAEMHHALTFLSDLDPERLDRRFLARSAIAACPAIKAPLHLILHSGLGGSTLMARALRQEGVVTTLKEPPILTDVIAYGLADRPRGATDRLRDDVAKLLARPLFPGEAVVIKMSSIGNGMVAAVSPQTGRRREFSVSTPRWT